MPLKITKKEVIEIPTLTKDMLQVTRDDYNCPNISFKFDVDLGDIQNDVVLEKMIDIIIRHQKELEE